MKMTGGSMEIVIVTVDVVTAQVTFTRAGPARPTGGGIAGTEASSGGASGTLTGERDRARGSTPSSGRDPDSTTSLMAAGGEKRTGWRWQRTRRLGKMATYNQHHHRRRPSITSLTVIIIIIIIVIIINNTTMPCMPCMCTNVPAHTCEVPPLALDVLPP